VVQAAVEDVLGHAAQLVDRSGCEVIAAWQGPDVSDALRAALPDGTSAGLSSTVADVAAFAQAVAEARAALAVARGGVAAYDALGWPTRSWRSCLTAARSASTRCSRLCGTRSRGDADAPVVLRARPGHHRLRGALHLHPNSLRYRLAKIEQALGRSLRSPQTIADLYLALRAGELHAHSDLPT
jgi:hypothetical protein